MSKLLKKKKDKKKIIRRLDFAAFSRYPEEKQRFFVFVVLCW